MSGELCVECEEPAAYWHAEDLAMIYSCERHRCSECVALDAISRLEAEVVNLSEELVLAKAVIARVRDVLDNEQRNYSPPLGLIARLNKVLEGGAE